jgi:lipid II:glycine glycyltransferase (peptidoglycan interpeptide bridge formation enzyme)
MQSRFWARFKAGFGWRPRYYVVGRGEAAGGTAGGTGGGKTGAAPLLVLTRTLGPTHRLAYVPHGPEDAALREAGGLEPLARALAEALEQRTLAIRFDLPQEAAGGAGHGLPFRRAPVDVQPPSTVIVDLSGEEDEILAAMKSKTRYNVRLSAKRGVRIVDATPAPPAHAAPGPSANTDGLERWYELYRETAERDRIAIHSWEYYRALFETAAAFEEVDLSLLLAEHEGDLLGGIIVLRYGETATYLYGASSNAKRNLMAPYGLQWEAMRRARRAGAGYYDLFGIPPADDPGHPMHGLYRFKTGFGGRIVHRQGAWDYPLSKPAYGLYRRAEGLRNVYFKRIKKRR